MSYDYDDDNGYDPAHYNYRKGPRTVASAYDLAFPPPTSNKADAIRQARQLLTRAGVKAEIVVQSVEWKPGDVVVLRYSRAGTPYTYVRGEKGWPGERFNKTDQQITDLYLSGCVTPVLQSGGVPFDAKRLS